jgi:hypothetical protein
MANLTPIEEYNKKILESGREIQKSTDSLRTPFKQLVGRIKETNEEFAKIAADNIGQTQDTWKGLITQGKKERLIRAQENDKRFKSDSAAVKKQEENQALLETRKQQLEEDYIINREKLLKADFYGKDSLRALNKDKLVLENKYNNATNANKIKIAKDLEQLSSTISTRESNITKTLDSQKAFEVESIDDRIKQEQLATRKQRKYIDETNTELEFQLDKASKTENYDKFTKGIKTLTGGMVDISGVLDPVAEQLGALRDVTSVLATPFKAGLSKIGDFFKEEKEELSESNEEFMDKNEESQKKSDKSLFGWIKKLGVSGVLILALVAAIIATIAKFGDLDKSLNKFGNFLKTFSGNKDDDARDALTDLTETFKEEFKNAKTKEEQDALVNQFKIDQDKLLTQQRNRVDQVGMQDGLNVIGDAALISANSRLGVNATQVGMDIKDGFNNPPPTAVNPNTGNIDMRLKENRNPSTWKKVKEAAKRTLTPKKLIRGNAAMQILGAGLTAQEVMDEMDNIDTARGKVEYLNVNGFLTPEEYDQALIDLEEMEAEAYIKPTAMGIVAGVGSLLIGAALVGSGAGAVPGIAIAAGGAALLAGTTGIVTDLTWTGDDKIYELLERKGINIDPDVAADNLEVMENMEKDTSNMIEQGTNNLNDTLNSRPPNSTVTTAVQNNNSSSSTTLVGGNTPPQNLDSTNLGLNYSAMAVTP